MYVPNTKKHLRDIFSKFKGVAWVDGKAFFGKKENVKKYPEELLDNPFDLILLYI